ncbi:MAG: hypothetical protein ACQPRI_06235 [Solitalea-like symbiont of Tyrophagus putrescentiae]
MISLPRLGKLIMHCTVFFICDERDHFKWLLLLDDESFLVEVLRIGNARNGRGVSGFNIKLGGVMQEETILIVAIVKKIDARKGEH